MVILEVPFHVQVASGIGGCTGPAVADIAVQYYDAYPFRKPQVRRVQMLRLAIDPYLRSAAVLAFRNLLLGCYSILRHLPYYLTHHVHTHTTTYQNRYAKMATMIVYSKCTPKASANFRSHLHSCSPKTTTFTH